MDVLASMVIFACAVRLRLLTLTLATPPVPAMIVMFVWLPSETLPSASGVASLIVITTLLLLGTVHVATARRTAGSAMKVVHHAALASTARAVVGTVGGSGVVKTRSCGKGTIVPPTSADPPSLNAVGVPAWQSPTPVRGVSRLPLTRTWPVIDRLPLVPTPPPELAITGAGGLPARARES